MCSGHMTECSNERKGFKYLSIYSKHAQAAIKNINAKKRGRFFLWRFEAVAAPDRKIRWGRF